MEKDALRPWTTDHSDPATALNGMSFRNGPESEEVTVGGGVQTIQVADGETVIGTHDVIVKPRGNGGFAEDPKFRGQKENGGNGGVHPMFEH